MGDIALYLRQLDTHVRYGAYVGSAPGYFRCPYKAGNVLAVQIGMLSSADIFRIYLGTFKKGQHLLLIGWVYTLSHGF